MFQSYDNETHHPYGPNASNETEIYVLLTWNHCAGSWAAKWEQLPASKGLSVCLSVSLSLSKVNFDDKIIVFWCR